MNYSLFLELIDKKSWGSRLSSLFFLFFYFFKYLYDFSSLVFSRTYVPFNHEGAYHQSNPSRPKQFILEFHYFTQCQNYVLVIIQINVSTG